MWSIERYLDLFRTPWHPTDHPEPNPRYWMGWDGYTKLVRPRYLIYPYAMFEAVPDGDALYAIRLQGAWSEASLQDLRGHLKTLLPLRHTLLPHSKGLATVVVYCAPAPERRYAAGRYVQRLALVPAARSLAAVIRACLMNYPEIRDPPSLLHHPVPGSDETMRRMVALLEREIRFRPPMIGLGSPSVLGSNPPNHFAPEIRDYGDERHFGRGETGWTKWRHGWGYDLTQVPERYLRDHFVAPEEADLVVRALCTL